MPQLCSLTLARTHTHTRTRAGKLTSPSRAAGLCYATVGVHPCAATSFDKHPGGPSALLDELRALATSTAQAGHTVAFGEFGLDYDRLHFTPRDQQLQYFELQLDLAVELQLPLFLHCRAAAEDFERLVGARMGRLPRGGLVHSFTGTMEEMWRLVGMGLDVGVNGCSLKSEGNAEVVREVPLGRLQIETDGPWVSWSSLRGFSPGYSWWRWRWVAVSGRPMS